MSIGKSQLAVRLLKEMDAEQPFRRCTLIYRYWQPAYIELRDHFGDARFHATQDFSDQLIDGDDQDEQCNEHPALIVLDDCYQIIAGDCQALQNALAGASHHRGVTLVILLQSVFMSNKPAYRTAMRNLKLASVVENASSD